MSRPRFTGRDYAVWAACLLMLAGFFAAFYITWGRAFGMLP